MFNTPERILGIQKFGVAPEGQVFSDEELADKSAYVRKLMEARPEVGKPRISVVIPALQEERGVLATCRSLAEQTARQCEFIIVTNGEPYGNPTQRIAEASGFNVINVERASTALARELGRKEAKGGTIITTDADAIHPADWAEVIGDYMDENPDVVAGTGDLHMLSERWLYRAYLNFHNVVRRLVGGVGVCMEANTFFRNDAADLTTGYDTTLAASQNPTFLNQLTPYGKIGYVREPGAEVYVSDRRLLKGGLPRELRRLGQLFIAGLSGGRIKPKGAPAIR